MHYWLDQYKNIPEVLYLELIIFLSRNNPKMVAPLGGMGVASKGVPLVQGDSNEIKPDEHHP